MNRRERRAFVKERRIVRPTSEQLIERIRDPEMPPEGKALAREWLRFEGTRASNVLGRLNANAKRRAKGKVAKRSRKLNRGSR